MTIPAQWIAFVSLAETIVKHGLKDHATLTVSAIRSFHTCNQCALCDHSIFPSLTGEGVGDEVHLRSKTKEFCDCTPSDDAKGQWVWDHWWLVYY